MAASLQVRFERFLVDALGAESIDALHVRSSQDGRRADYYLDDRRIVVEVKSLQADQAPKGTAVVDEYLKDTGIVAYGTLPLARVARNEQHERAVRTAIYRRMSRRIEQICHSANGQLSFELKSLPHLATGVLVVLNECVTSMHPGLVAQRVLEFVDRRPRNIHFCLLVFESHKIRVDTTLLPYPILMNLASSARQRRAWKFLDALQWQWAQQYGHKRPVRSDEGHPTAYYPEWITLGAE